MVTRAFLSCLALVLAISLAGAAGAVERIGWQDLAPPIDASDDPLNGLSDDLRVDFLDVIWVRSLEPTGAMTEEFAAIGAEAEARLVAEGVDIEALIAEAVAYDKIVEARNATLVEGLDGREVQIPGYILPLEFDGTSITEFLLVPYVGACIHVPPPPPNQIVYVRVPDGFESEGLFVPVWVAGRITTGHSSQSLSYIDGVTDIAVGYTLDATDIEIYDD